MLFRRLQATYNSEISHYTFSWRIIRCNDSREYTDMQWKQSRAESGLPVGVFPLEKTEDSGLFLFL